MEMEFAAEVTMARDRAGQIIRGKRTKRQRPCSPFGVAAATSSSSSGGGGGGGNGSGDGGCVMNYYTTDQQSTAMSSDMSTEEDEDMANCLIMLAQSVSPIKEEKSTDHHRQKTEKLSSRRFTEIAAAAASGKAGFYVYECKTCNRSFPSFQALGGHRASHKKPKLAVEEKKSASINIPIPPPLTEYSDEKPKVIIEDEENKIIINNNDKSSTPPPGFIQTVHNNKSKVHECSICGSEFLSGQALGGHMRRHRTTPPSTSSNQVGISMNIDDRSREVIEKSSRSTSMLSLDLNLPAPEVVDDVHSTYQFPASSSQQHLVFSAPALVDCHY